MNKKIAKEALKRIDEVDDAIRESVVFSPRQMLADLLEIMCDLAKDAGYGEVADECLSMMVHHELNKE